MFNQKWQHVIAALGMAVLAGCQTNNIDYGNGPITLNDNTMASFELYLMHEDPLYFAVQWDGFKYGYSVCNEPNCFDSVGDVALSTCRRRSKGERCYLLAVGRDLVWNGPISYRVGRFIPPNPNGRAFTFSWHPKVMQYSGRRFIRGVIENGTAGPVIELKFDRRQRRTFGKCEGNLNVETKRFDVTCSKKGTVSGHYEIMETGNVGGKGAGEDGQGEIAELIIIPKSKLRDTFTRKTE